MQELTLLEEKQIFGEKALDIIKKRGTKAAITDFAILLGGFVSNNYHVDGGNALDKITGWYWTKTDDSDYDARVVNNDGSSGNYAVHERDGGVRPALPFSRIQLIPTNEVSGRKKDGILEIEYGYYPRSAVPIGMQHELEQAFEHWKLNQTGNTYTTDSRRHNDYDNSFLPQSFIEYEYNGKRYVRVKENSYYNKFILSNGETYKDGDYVWVSVEPVKWLVDEKTKLMITEEVIVAGVQFKNKRDYDGDYWSRGGSRYCDYRSLSARAGNSARGRRHPAGLRSLRPQAL